MKNLLLLSLLVIGCKNYQEQDVETSIRVGSSEIPQWVTYEAKDNSQGKHVVLVSGDEEYRSEEAMPQLAKILTQHHGFDCTVLFSQDPEKPGLIDPNYSFNIPGLAQLEKADLVILFTRFRALPEEQMMRIENYLLSGQPIIAIRTATHAFHYEDKEHAFSHYGFNYKGDNTDWHFGFGKRILGETWYVHHGHHKHQSTRGIIAQGSENHPIVNGIKDGAIWGSTDVYGVRQPIGEDAQNIVLGQTIDRAGKYDANDIFYGMRETDTKIASVTKQNNKDQYDPNEVMPPIVWTKSYQLPNGEKGQSITSTIGASSDMLDEEVRRLFVNSTYHLLGLEVPIKAEVELIGDYQPSQYNFHTDEYWESKQMRVSDYTMK